MNFPTEIEYSFYSLEGEFKRKGTKQPEYFTGIIKYSAENYSSVEYWLNGKLHRIDGPAVEYSDINNEYWVYGKKVTELQCKLLEDMMKLNGLI